MGASGAQEGLEGQPNTRWHGVAAGELVNMGPEVGAEAVAASGPRCERGLGRGSSRYERGPEASGRHQQPLV